MKPISFKRYRFPADVVSQAVWLYFCFSFSFRDAEELMAARGDDFSYETIRCWTNKFGPLIAWRLKRRVHPCHPVGVLTKSSVGLVESVCFFGARSTMKEKFSTSWSSASGTKRLH